MPTLKYTLLRTSDALVGGWLCRHLRPRARAGVPEPTDAAAPIPPSEIERLLVIRPGGIGDAALTWPMIHALRSHYPAARVEVLAERRNAGVYRIGRGVDEIHLYDRRPWSTLRRLRRAAFDLVIDTEQFHHLSAVAANAVRPRYFCGFDTLCRGRLQTHRVPYSEADYEIESFLRLAATVTGQPIPFDCDAPFLEVDESSRQWAAEALGPVGERPPVVIVPTASGRYKQWPESCWREVMAWLDARGDAVILLGGRDSRRMAADLLPPRPSAPVLNLAGRTSLPQTAAVLERARVLVSSDTGVVHLAYGVGTPTVSLFGPGIPGKWVPPSDRHRAVRLGLPCSPCTRFGRVPRCPYGAACMQSLPAERVTMALEEVMGS